jgi:hypothetical protein
MVVGLLTLDIHLPYARSLKDKRQTLRKLKERLRARFNVAVAELGHQDTWQRAAVGVVSVSNEKVPLQQLLQDVSAESENILGDDLVGSYVEFL